MSAEIPIGMFDYTLPNELIAQKPVEPRDSSRLLSLSRETGEIRHARFRALDEFLGEGDLVVVNSTQVIPARLIGRKATGGRVELLLCRPVGEGFAESKIWLCLGKPATSLKPGRQIWVGETVLTIGERSGNMLSVHGEQPLWGVLQAQGEIPLPPYINREGGPSDADRADYQSIFAREVGAVAAPTASLHFTRPVLDALESRGVTFAEIVLHVGPGTFLPIRQEASDDVRRHVMHSEGYRVPDDTATMVRQAKKEGRRVIAVGTTSVRALEAWHRTGCQQGETSLFIYPGFEFRVVDGMLTNFHLPCSTLLMLVSAFAGRDRVMDAYEQAVAERYRFFSYGDVMFVH